MVFLRFFSIFFMVFSLCAYHKLLLRCVKIIRIRSYSSSHFPAFKLNTDQDNSKYGYFSDSVAFIALIPIVKFCFFFL